MDFFNSLQKPISFKEFNATDCEKLLAVAQTIYKQFGALNYCQLSNDNLLKIDKEDSEEIVNTPLTCYKEFSKAVSKMITLG